MYLIVATHYSEKATKVQGFSYRIVLFVKLLKCNRLEEDPHVVPPQEDGNLGLH